MASRKPTGRPSKFTPLLADTICLRLSHGESLRAICLDDAMPDKATVLRWLADPKYTIFRDQYARAREAQADAIVEECLEISDDGRNDWMERRSEAEKGAGVSNGWVLNGEHVQRSRLRVDTRKWWAARLAPKKYGDKVALSGDADNPVQQVIRWATGTAEGTADPSERGGKSNS